MKCVLKHIEWTCRQRGTAPNCFVSFVLRHCSSKAGFINIFTQFLWSKIPHGELINIHYGNTESAFPVSLVSFDKHRFLWSCHCAESALSVSIVTFNHSRSARSGQPGSRRTSASTVSPAKPHIVYRDCGTGPCRLKPFPIFFVKQCVQIGVYGRVGVS